jgi:hypothetical protein
VDIPHTYNNFRNDSFDNDLSEWYFFSFEVKIKIAFGQILHNDVDIRLILKGFANADQKILMANMLNELALKHVEFFYLGFLNDFHGV